MWCDYFAVGHCHTLHLLTIPYCEQSYGIVPWRANLLIEHGCVSILALACTFCCTSCIEFAKHAVIAPSCALPCINMVAAYVARIM